MAAELASAVDRFLGNGGDPAAAAAVRQAARAAFSAWRDGQITTSQALFALGTSREVMRSLVHRP